MEKRNIYKRTKEDDVMNKKGYINASRAERDSEIEMLRYLHKEQMMRKRYNNKMMLEVIDMYIYITKRYADRLWGVIEKMKIDDEQARKIIVFRFKVLELTIEEQAKMITENCNEMLQMKLYYEGKMKELGQCNPST